MGLAADVVDPKALNSQSSSLPEDYYVKGVFSALSTNMQHDENIILREGHQAQDEIKLA